MLSRVIRAESPELDGITRFDFGALLGTLPGSETPVMESAPLPAFSGGMASPGAEGPDFHETTNGAVSDQQAELISGQDRLRAAELEKEGYEKGFSEGEKAGKEVGEKMVEAVLKQYASTLEELKALRRSILSSSEREVVKLALEVARKVVKREVTIDEELILALVKVALSRLADQSVMTVRVNPKDYQSILQHRSAPVHRESLHEGIRLLEDPLIARGGCLIETESGIVDARVEEQFREIEKGFFE